MVKFEERPPRYAEREDELGRLMREANESFRADAERAVRFRRPEAPVSAPRWPWMWRGALGGAALVTMAGVLVWRSTYSGQPPSGHLTAEAPSNWETRSEASSIIGRPGLQARPEDPSIVPAPPSARTGQAGLEETSGAGQAEGVPQEPPLIEPRAVVPSPEVAPKAVVPLGGVETPQRDSARESCLALVRSGSPQGAEACFAKQARVGSGLDAEVALYELARLRQDALGNPSGALRALEEHRRRFPNGALIAEVSTSYLSLLARAGRASEALAESQRLLASPAGKERQGELRLMRGHLLRRGGDLNAAQKEYALAEAGKGAEASYYNGLCLEQLGRLAAARSAYKRYLLANPSGKRASEIRERLEALSVPAP